MTQLAPLAPEDIITQFESLVDDSLDETTEYFLLNDVKDTLEADDEWAILKTSDESQTANVGDNYLTMKPLPIDFGAPSPRGIYVGTDLVPYRQVDFEERLRYQAETHVYYIDFANEEYALCGGVNPSGTIHFYYQKSSPALVRSGTPWIFPARFHPILPMLMSIMYPAIDQPDKSRAWDDRWEKFGTQRTSIMRRWNARIMREAYANSFRATDIDSYPDRISMDGSGDVMGVYG